MCLSNESNSQASPQKKIKWYTQVFNVKWFDRYTAERLATAG